jgi:hypothetical protein
MKESKEEKKERTLKKERKRKENFGRVKTQQFHWTTTAAEGRS